MDIIGNLYFLPIFSYYLRRTNKGIIYSPFLGPKKEFEKILRCINYYEKINDKELYFITCDSSRKKKNLSDEDIKYLENKYGIHIIKTSYWFHQKVIYLYNDKNEHYGILFGTGNFNYDTLTGSFIDFGLAIDNFKENYKSPYEYYLSKLFNKYIKEKIKQDHISIKIPDIRKDKKIKKINFKSKFDLIDGSKLYKEYLKVIKKAENAYFVSPVINYSIIHNFRQLNKYCNFYLFCGKLKKENLEVFEENKTKIIENDSLKIHYKYSLIQNYNNLYLHIGSSNITYSGLVNGQNELNLWVSTDIFALKDIDKILLEFYKKDSIKESRQSLLEYIKDISTISNKPIDEVYNILYSKKDFFLNTFLPELYKVQEYIIQEYYYNYKGPKPDFYENVIIYNSILGSIYEIEQYHKNYRKKSKVF